MQRESRRAFPGYSLFLHRMRFRRAAWRMWEVLFLSLVSDVQVHIGTLSSPARGRICSGWLSAPLPRSTLWCFSSLSDRPGRCPPSGSALGGAGRRARHRLTDAVHLTGSGAGSGRQARSLGGLTAELTRGAHAVEGPAAPAPAGQEPDPCCSRARPGSHVPGKPRVPAAFSPIPAWDRSGVRALRGPRPAPRRPRMLLFPQRTCTFFLKDTFYNSVLDRHFDGQTDLIHV